MSNFSKSKEPNLQLWHHLVFLVIYSQCKVSRNIKPTTNNLVYIWDSSLICTQFHLSSTSYTRKPGRWQAPRTKKTEVQQCFLKWHVAPMLPVSLLSYIKRPQMWGSSVACHHTHTTVLVQGLRMRPTFCRASPSPWSARCLGYS